MGNAQFVGISELSELDQATIKELVEKGQKKIEQQLQHVVRLKVHLKQHNLAGTRKKYSVHLKVTAPTKTFVSTKAIDWELKTAFQKAISGVEKQITHTLSESKTPPWKERLRFWKRT